MSSALEVAKGIEGFDYDEFFRSYAELWVLKTTEEMYQVLLQDVHAPNYLRANVNVQQFEEFYETYGRAQRRRDVFGAGRTAERLVTQKGERTDCLRPVWPEAFVCAVRRHCSHNCFSAFTKQGVRFRFV